MWNTENMFNSVVQKFPDWRSSYFVNIREEVIGVITELFSVNDDLICLSGCSFWSNDFKYIISYHIDNFWQDLSIIVATAKYVIGIKQNKLGLSWAKLSTKLAG